MGNTAGHSGGFDEFWTTQRDTAEGLTGFGRSIVPLCPYGRQLYKKKETVTFVKHPHSEAEWAR